MPFERADKVGFIVSQTPRTVQVRMLAETFDGRTHGFFVGQAF